MVRSAVSYSFLILVFVYWLNWIERDNCVFFSFTVEYMRYAFQVKLNLFVFVSKFFIFVFNFDFKTEILFSFYLIMFIFLYSVFNVYFCKFCSYQLLNFSSFCKDLKNYSQKAQINLMF